jgi:hypothetical protein
MKFVRLTHLCRRPSLWPSIGPNGDLQGVQQNMTHELYHMMQKATAKRIPTLAAIVRDPAKLPLPERLLATTLWEGYRQLCSKTLQAKTYCFFFSRSPPSIPPRFWG